MYCTCGLYGLNFFLCFCFCFFDKVQQLEQEKFSLEGAMQELGQVGFFFCFLSPLMLSFAIIVVHYILKYFVLVKA